ncbi:MULTISPECIES: DNA topoisomerase IB [unclassified Mycobacterium]|uniref:DNA topoisomerase IB n=1 Tax=unclassified Mycobacterium TaxID=2642494 RepID=UPI000421A2D6|nr:MULTISPECIES: DNA topoisomerase IB [unclassified Mycobacterium]
MRLRRSTTSGPGLRRIGRGRGFSYADGHHPVDDPEVLARIKALAIPPAWRKVWICPYPNGHIQAVGVDAAGRRQYLYHPQWQAERSEEKFDRALTLAKLLPDWRAEVLADLRGRGLKRDRVLAVAQQLIDRGYFRAGGEEYAQENGSFGLATLLRDHVTLRTGCVDFDYPAKSGVRRTVSVDDPLVVRAVRALLRAPTDLPRLLVYRTSDGWCEVRADDLNERFRELTDEQFSVKDLRTWHGTVLAAESFAAACEPTSKTVRRREVAAVMRYVAEELGNTPAVARSSYVDPRVVQAYEQGITIRSALDRARGRRKDAARRLATEAATARMIRRIDRAGK